MDHRRSVSDAQMRARALARWEGEGGALASRQDEDYLDAAEIQLLARLGAALLESWPRLGPAEQAAIVQRAATLGATGDRARASRNLAELLSKQDNAT